VKPPGTVNADNSNTSLKMYSSNSIAENFMFFPDESPPI
jgi:hypothetical protein